MINGQRAFIFKSPLFKGTEKVMPMTAYIILSFLKSNYKMCNDEFANVRTVETSCEQNTYHYQITWVFIDYFLAPSFGLLRITGPASGFV